MNGQNLFSKKSTFHAITRELNAMEEKTKKVKTNLVRTRNLIKKKFQKLYSERVKNERNLKEKYAPITNSIKELVKVKQKVKPEKATNVININNIKNEEDDYDDDDSDDDDGDDDDDEKEKQDVFDMYDADTTYEMDSHSNGDTDQMEFISGNSKRGRRVSNDENASSPHKQRVEKRTRLLSEPTISKNLGRNTDQMEFISENSKRRRRVSSGDNALSPHKQRVEKRTRLLSEPNEKYQHISTPADLKPLNTIKKSKTKLEKMEEQLFKLHDIREAGVQHIEKKMKERKKPFVHDEASALISPEDYDEEGNFRGTSTKRKRSKIVLPTQHFKQILRTVKTKRKNRNKKYASGRGLEKKFIPYNTNIVYEYFDDPNELCDRLRLLISSKAAGNSNHDQEINSIAQELRELKIIA